MFCLLYISYVEIEERYLVTVRRLEYLDYVRTLYFKNMNLILFRYDTKTFQFLLYSRKIIKAY